jgi:hypothetical protein
MPDDRDQADVEKMVRAYQERRAPTAEWQPFSGNPESLGLSVLDTIRFINARYVITKGVIERYGQAVVAHGPGGETYSPKAPVQSGTRFAARTQRHRQMWFNRTFNQAPSSPPVSTVAGPSWHPDPWGSNAFVGGTDRPVTGHTHSYS